MFLAENEARGDAWALLLDDIFRQGAVVGRELAADQEMGLHSPRSEKEIANLRAAAAPLIGYEALVRTIQPRVSGRGPSVVQGYKQSSWSPKLTLAQPSPLGLRTVKRTGTPEEPSRLLGVIETNTGRPFEVWDIDTKTAYYEPNRLRRSRSELKGIIVAADPAASEIMVETSGYRRKAMWLVRLLNQQEEEFKPLAEVRLLQRPPSQGRSQN